MFTDFFNLTASPFRLTPDPRFFFDGKSHSQAMAHILYGLTQGDGFVVITGEVGAGKTTLVEHLCRQLNPVEYAMATISSTQLSPVNFLRAIVLSFGLIGSSRSDKSVLLNTLSEFFQSNGAAGKRTLLVIDEAQNLPFASLEELRMLANLTVRPGGSLAILLLGQPQFRSRLSGPGAEQLRQRIFTCYHLGTLDATEVKTYIEHRLQVVGWRGDPSFTPEAFATIYRHTEGVPRKINLLCSRLLLSAYFDERHGVGADDVEAVAAEWTRELGAVMAPSRVAEAPMAADAPPSPDNRKRNVAAYDAVLEQPGEQAPPAAGPRR